MSRCSATSAAHHLPSAGRFDICSADIPAAAASIALHVASTVGCITFDPIRPHSYLTPAIHRLEWLPLESDSHLLRQTTMRTMLRSTTVPLVFGVLILLGGCSSEPEKPKQEASAAKPAESKPAESGNQYETGRVAFQKAYVTARGWAPDAKPYRMESSYTTDAPVVQGKAGIWRAPRAS